MPMKINSLNAAQLAAYFDHSLLQPFNVRADFDKLADEVRRYGFYSAMVNSAMVPYVAGALRDSGIVVGATAGFPFGQASVAAKLAEAAQAIRDGAGEIDYVLHIGRLLDGDRAYILDEMRRMTACCHDGGALCKVILENCYLRPEQIKAACEIALETDIDFVKTSTGFGPGGATVRDVRLMRETVGERIKVKPAGAMKTLENAAVMIELGVDRIGSAFGPAIVDEFLAAKARGETLNYPVEDAAGSAAGGY